MKNMIRIISLSTIFILSGSIIFAQEKGGGNEQIEVPAVVKSALKNKYPQSNNVTWEKEDGNYEANWGGKSGEDNSVQFTSSGNFIEVVKATPINELPKKVTEYVKEYYNGAKITEAGKVTDAHGKLSYEVEVHGKDILFNEKGNFIKAEN